MHNYKQLKVWNDAVDLSVLIYKIVSRFPNEEKFGLSSQIKRSATSIAANIAEGAGRGGDKEFCYFLNIAQGSAYELETHIIIATKLSLMSEEDANNTLE